MPQRNLFVAPGIIVLDFELFIGDLFTTKMADNALKLPALVCLRSEPLRFHRAVVDADAVD